MWLSEVDKHQTCPNLQLNGLEAELLGIKILELSEARCSAEATVEAISPAMVRAGEKLRVAFPFNETGSVMPTYIIKGSQFPVLIPRYDHRLIDVLIRDVVSTLFELSCWAKVEPMIQKKFVLFCLSKLLFKIPRAGGSPRVFDVLLGIEVV